MPSLLTARNLPGIGDFHPPEDENPPECERCDGSGATWHDDIDSMYVCPDCNGTGYQPEPEYEPGIEVEE